MFSCSDSKRRSKRRGRHYEHNANGRGDGLIIGETSV